MTSIALVKRMVALTMSVVMFVGALMVTRAEAGLITTEQFRAGQALADQDQVGQDMSAERSRIQEVMARADVRQQMVALGVDPAEAEARLAALSDEEVGALAGRLDQLPAGQAVFETAILAVLFAFVILLVTDILGYTDIFPFVKKQVDRP